MPGRSKERVFLGLGGNLGDPRAAMAAALRDLEQSGAIRVAAVSSLYRTPPWGKTDQPDFLNAVAEIATDLEPRQVLSRCLYAEERLKRVRTERWGPRLIDIDILIFGNRIVHERGLEIPHPRMLERAFVLVPLAEIAPTLEVDGRTVFERAFALGSAGIVKLDGSQDWWR